MYSSKRQKSVATSTMEAEFQALAHTSQEVMWLCQFFDGLHMPTESATAVLIDNMAAMEFARNPTHHSHDKHIDVKLMASRKYIQERIIELSFVPMCDNLANILTKALPSILVLGRFGHGHPLESLSLCVGNHFPHNAFNKELDVLFEKMELLD